MRLETAHASRLDAPERVLVVATALLPLNAVAVRSGPTVADLLLVAIPLVILVRPSRGAGARATTGLLGGLLLVLAGGVLAGVVAGDPSGIWQAVKLVGGAMAAVLVVVVVQPGAAARRAIGIAFAAGAGFSAASSALSDATQYGGRVSGLAVHPNHLAVTCVLGISFALALLADAGARRRVRAGALCAAALCGWGVLESGSRAGLVALLVVLLVHACSQPRRAATAAAALLVAAPVLALSSPALPPNNAAARLVGSGSAAVTADRSDEERSALLDQAQQRLAEHPFSGSGFRHVKDVHNVYLQVLVGSGLLGLLGLGLVLVVLAHAVARLLGARAPAFALPVGYAGAVVGFAVDGLAQNILWDRYLWVPLAVAASAPARAAEG